MNSIVTVNVSQTIAPTPDNLQKRGAFISQGGTTTIAGTKTLLTQPSDLIAVQFTAKAVTSLTYSGGTVTAVVAAHGLPIGDEVYLTVAGAVPTGYNGNFLCRVTDATHFTYAVPADPGSETTPGTWVTTSSLELTQMVTTFFNQGSGQGVYVLELGAGNPTEGVTALTAWIAANPGFFYSYLVPRSWDAVPAFLSLLVQNNGTTAKTYFHVTTTLATYSSYTALMKSAVATVEAPAYGTWAANALVALSFSGAWGANVFTALSWAATGGGQATATTTTAHGIVPGNTFTVSGCTPAGYNGTVVALPGTTGSTLVWSLPTDPGVESVLGQVDASTAGTATGTTTTAHGVLPGQTFTISGSVAATIAGGYNGTVTALPGTTGTTLKWSLPANPGSASLDGTLQASYYSSTGVASTEFTAAAGFRVALNYKPSTTNKVTPFSFAFVFGVTPFPTQGNAAILAALKAASINVIGTGAEGGISDAILLWGTTADGRDFTYWYSVDWVQTQVDLAVANEIINGSNSPINPLYYNQSGINRLQQVVARVMGSGVTFGLVLGSVTQTQLDGPVLDQALDAGTYDGLTVVNAVPFVPYSQENPSDYSIGQYNGIAISYTPTRGFTAIVINVNVTDFVTQ